MARKEIPTHIPEPQSRRAAAASRAAAEVAPTGAGLVDGVEIARRAENSYRFELARILTTRRFELLPPVGEGAPITKAQGRDHGEDTSAEGLTDLISSISHMGVLQPILVEEVTQPDGSVSRIVVAGERRLRAVRQGHLDPKEQGNPHFTHIPAVIVTGPVGEAEVRSWQLIENLARDDLRPGELAAALLFERCAILTAKITAARMQAVANGDTGAAAKLHIPEHVSTIDDPVDRFNALEKIRGRNTAAAAPWDEVLNQLGMNLSERKARQLVAAFKALPRELSEEMDAKKVALHTRTAFAALRSGSQEAADEIWATLSTPSVTIPRTAIPENCKELRLRTTQGEVSVAVSPDGDTVINTAPRGDVVSIHAKVTDQTGDESLVEIDRESTSTSTATRLLHAATQIGLQDDSLPALECVQRAMEADTQAQLARHGKDTPVPLVDDNNEEVSGDNQEAQADGGAASRGGDVAESITPTLVALRSLIKEIDGGAEVSRYDRGSLQLLCRQLLTKLATTD